MAQIQTAIEEWKLIRKCNFRLTQRSMDIKEAHNNFYKKIESLLKPNGFKVLKNRQIAERKIKTGFYQLFFDMNKSYDFTYSNLCQLWIRNDRIQELRGKIIAKRVNSEKPTIITSIITYTKQIGRDDLEFELNRGNEINFEDVASIDKWFKAFKRFMNEAGFAFFDNFKTDADFDKWFNEPVINGTYDFSKGMLWNDSVNGLVAAKLVNNPRYEILYRTWHEKLTESKDTNTLEELERMYAFLKTIK